MRLPKVSSSKCSGNTVKFNTNARSECSCYHICCKEECDWSLYATIGKHSSHWHVTRMSNQHTLACSGMTHLEHANASTQILSNEVLDTIRDQPTYRPSEI